MQRRYVIGLAVRCVNFSPYTMEIFSLYSVEVPKYVPPLKRESIQNIDYGKLLVFFTLYNHCGYVKSVDVQKIGTKI